LHASPRRAHPVIYLLLAFLAGCLFAGFFLNRYRFTDAGELDKRYNKQHARAAETIGRLEEELERERRLNRELRAHNNRARELTDELTGTTERNVRNLQEAVGFIGEIRKKLKVLEDFYADRDTGGGSR